MKNSYDFTLRSHRGARASAVALIAASLMLGAGYAQGTSAPGPSTHGSTTNPQAGRADTSGTSTTAPRTDDTSTATSGSYGSAQSTAAGSQSGSSSELKRSEKKFITKVAESSPKEVAMAQLAVERASNPQIKSYAQQLISDHRQMSQELAQLAQEKGVTLEHSMARSGSTSGTATSGTMASNTSGTTAGAGSMNVPEDIKSDRHYRSLSQKSGAEFDREFVDMMVDDHKKDVKMFREQADDAKDPAVRQFASKNVEVLQGHLDRAQTLNQSLAE